MRRLIVFLVVTLAFMDGLTTASGAAPWQSINQRQAILEDRIDQGIRNGALTRTEAIVLRGEFNTLERLEANYRRSGGHLSAGERRELDERFEALRLRIRIQRRDAQERPGTRWVSINDRQERLDARIDQGVKGGTLTRAEAIQLRGEFKTLVRLESEYRQSRGAFTMEERADLDRRLERLSSRVAVERRDSQGRF
jgi:hypothetical protein